jgi:type IV secretion system protein VirB5
MFKRPATHYGKSPQPETPYQRAAQVWDDRIGSARVQARNWRFMAFGSLALSPGLSAALVWQSANGSIVPWVVQVDRLGQAQAVAPATADYQPNDPQIAFYLARFIEQVRSIPADAIIVRQNWLRAYDFTTEAARSRSTTTRGRTTRSPRSASSRSRSKCPASSAPRPSFRVAWIERRYQDGALAATERWSAILTVAVQPPRDADTLRKNPLGIYVNAINWSKELGQ